MSKTPSNKLPMSSETIKPDPEPPKYQTLGLDGVAHDIHYLIASELMKSSPATVLALGQSSNTLRQATLPFIYRDLVLRKKKSGPSDFRADEAYQALIGQFRDNTNHVIAQHVRHLTIQNELPEEDLILIMDRLAEFGTLRKLSWETSSHIPESVLNKLQSTWPELELSVCVLDRQAARKPAHRQMDVRLLSSPLLRSLTYNVFCEGYNADSPGRSEWPKLTHALVTGGNVRALRLECLYDTSYKTGGKVLSNSEPEAMMRLGVTAGMQVPALKELTLRVQDAAYAWDNEHCELLLQTMDWSRLRKLDFGGAMPDPFFAAFQGRLPKLQALRFGVPWQSQPVSAVKRFIDSIENLEALDIGRAGAAINELWPSIYRHKDSLKELILRPTIVGYCSPEYIPLRRLKTLAAEFPSLERVGWDAPCQSNVDAYHLKILSTMKLRQLDLFLHIPGEKSHYSEELKQDAMGSIPAPPIHKAGSTAAAIKIMETISKAQDAAFEKLTLHLARTGYEDRGQPYMMHGTMQLRRSAVDGAHQVSGKQAWSWGNELAEELMLDEP